MKCIAGAIQTVVVSYDSLPFACIIAKDRDQSQQRRTTLPAIPVHFNSQRRLLGKLRILNLFSEYLTVSPYKKSLNIEYRQILILFIHRIC